MFRYLRLKGEQARKERAVHEIFMEDYWNILTENKEHSIVLQKARDLKYKLGLLWVSKNIMVQYANLKKYWWNTLNRDDKGLSIV